MDFRAVMSEPEILILLGLMTASNIGSFFYGILVEKNSSFGFRMFSLAVVGIAIFIAIHHFRGVIYPEALFVPKVSGMSI